MELRGSATRLRRGYGVPDIEGKATSVGASKPGGERVSTELRGSATCCGSETPPSPARSRPPLSAPPGRDPRERIEVRVAQHGRTIWIIDAHRDGTRFVVRVDEKLTAFVELALADST